MGTESPGDPCASENRLEASQLRVRLISVLHHRSETRWGYHDRSDVDVFLAMLFLYPSQIQIRSKVEESTMSATRSWFRPDRVWQPAGAVRRIRTHALPLTLGCPGASNSLLAGQI